MQREDAERAVRDAIAQHIAERGLVTAPDKLTARILDSLVFSESFRRAGWLIERVPGKDIPGTPARRKKFRGWKLTDLIDGEVKWLPPVDSQGDVSQYWAEKFADQFREQKQA